MPRGFLSFTTGNLAAVLTSVGVIAAAGWWLVRPHVEQYVHERVVVELKASADIRSLQDRMSDREAWRSNSISRVSELEARVKKLEDAR